MIQDTKKMKKILKKEKINIDVKDISLIDEDGGTVEITLLGLHKFTAKTFYRQNVQLVQS